MTRGQICRGSNLGEKIYNFSKLEEVYTIVEIGTWLGLGSTKCILDGILDKESNKTVVYSLECNEDRHYQAGINLGKLPDNFHLMHGSIIKAKELRQMIGTVKQAIHRQWLVEDIEAVETAPNVFDKLPNRIDLCVMDGGEFSGYAEFMKLWERCRFIILDDINENKHKGTKKFILNNPDKFNVIEDNVNERNGFLICEVIKGEILSDNKLFKELDKLINKKHNNNFVVDIGASFNSHFLKYACSGILFDMDESKIIKIPSDNLYKKIHKKITPGNVLSTLKKYNVPYNFLALNLDIDSYDLFVLIQILKNYSPRIIITEINEKIPPPVSFSVRYHKDWYWKKDHFFGYSISCLEPILKRFGYYIHSLVYNNVILIKGNRNINIEREYKRGYLLADRRKGVFPWNNDVEYWQTLNAESLKKEIKKYCKKYKGSFAIGKVCENLIKIHL